MQNQRREGGYKYNWSCYAHRTAIKTILRVERKNVGRKRHYKGERGEREGYTISRGDLGRRRFLLRSVQNVGTRLVGKLARGTGRASSFSATSRSTRTAPTTSASCASRCILDCSTSQARNGCVVGNGAHGGIQQQLSFREGLSRVLIVPSSGSNSRSRSGRVGKATEHSRRCFHSFVRVVAAHAG